VGRFAQALGGGKGFGPEARDIASRWWETPQVAEAFSTKAAVSGATASHATWAGPLAAAGISDDALGWLRGVSIVAALEPRMRKVPFNVPVPRQTTAGTGGGRVPEGAAVAVVSWAYDTIRLEPAKIQELIVAANELLRPERRGAEQTLRETLLGNLAATIDRVFLDPAETGSITNGVTPITSTGTTAAQITADLAALLAAITTNKTALTWIMRPETAARIGLALGASAAALPQTLFGLPLIVSSHSPAQITLVDAAEIAYADDGAFDLELSPHGAIQMDSAPTNHSVTPTATNLVSMFQTDSTAFLASRWITWERLQLGAVSFMVVTY